MMGDGTGYTKSLSKLTMFVRINLRNNHFIFNMCKRIRKLLIHRRQSLTMSTPTQTLTSIHGVHRAMQQRQRARRHERTYVPGGKEFHEGGFPGVDDGVEIGGREINHVACEDGLCGQGD